MGAWDASSRNITHKGLEQYFLDYGYTVINSSTPGISNDKTIKNLEDSLSNSYKPGDIVFWIQTDALDHMQPFDTLTEDILSAGGVVALCQSCLKETYRTLNTVSKKFNTKIYLIGGNHDLYLDGLSQYPDLVPIVPSWVKLLVGHFKEYKNLFPQFTNTLWTIKNIDLSKYTLEFAAKVIDELYYTEQCQAMHKEELFQPDKFHPNKDGHKILFNYLIKELQL